MCQVQADDHDDGSGDDRRHQPLDPLVSNDHDHEPDQGVDAAANDDAAQRRGNVVSGADGLRGL